PLVWLQPHGVAELAACLLWGLFVSVLIHRQTISPIGWRVSLVAASVLVLGAAIVIVMADVFRIAPGPGPFEVAPFDPPGEYVAVLEILFSVAILAGLEAALRSASTEARGRIKFFALALAGIF